MGVDPGLEPVDGSHVPLDRNIINVQAAVCSFSLIGGAVGFGRFFETQGRIDSMRSANGHFSKDGCSDSCMLELMAWMPLLGWVGLLLLGSPLLMLAALTLCHLRGTRRRNLLSDLRAMVLLDITLAVVGSCCAAECLFELGSWGWVSGAAADSCCRCGPRPSTWHCPRGMDVLDEPDEGAGEETYECKWEQCQAVRHRNDAALPRLHSCLAVVLLLNAAALASCCTGVRLASLAECSAERGRSCGARSSQVQVVVGCPGYEPVSQSDAET